MTERKTTFNHEFGSESLSDQDLREDTDSFISSGDGDDLANEMKSRNEADDELATLFGSDDNNFTKSCNARSVCFQRPMNPIVNDNRFKMARCSAPSLEKQSMKMSSFTKSRSEAVNKYCHFE